MILVYTFLGFWISLVAARYFNVLDKPWPDVPERKRVPTIQWVTAFLLALWAAWVFYPEHLTQPWPFLWLWIWLACIVAVTFIDELWRIVSPKLRVWPLPRLIFWPLTSLVLTVGWFLLFINAINWFDGIYWLATWMSSIGFLTIAALLTLIVIPFYTGISPERLLLLENVSRYAWVFFIITFVGTLMEFRPSGLMRDVGTMAFGFALAYLALLWWAKIGTMIVVLMLPLFDAVWVIIDRLHRRNKNPMKGDFSHLHYRLMALWWNRSEVRIFIWGMSLFFVVLMLLQGTDRVWKIILFVMIALVFFGVNRYLFWKKGLPSEYDWKKFKDKS